MDTKSKGTKMNKYKIILFILPIVTLLGAVAMLTLLGATIGMTINNILGR